MRSQYGVLHHSKLLHLSIITQIQILHRLKTRNTILPQKPPKSERSFAITRGKITQTLLVVFTTFATPRVRVRVISLPQ